MEPAIPLTDINSTQWSPVLMKKAVETRYRQVGVAVALYSNILSPWNVESSGRNWFGGVWKEVEEGDSILHTLR